LSHGADQAVTRNSETGLVLGTAGHIDHGKSALVEALTGVDPDRLPEEKLRGITIDLGFASLDLGDGQSISVVDVPGHERLVRTMVAGATGIDLVLLVVAADEGVMPQTREHVAICDLLGIGRGVVALTKCDLADEDVLELATEEARELLAPTRLSDAAIVPVSAVTGDGLDALRAALKELVASAEPNTTRRGPPRLGIDRAFAIRGFGSVVTGTLVGGSLRVGESVELYPSGVRARIRGLQSHGRSCKRVAPGSRCAANLQGVDLTELSRGQVVSRPSALAPTSTADVELWWLESAPAGKDVVAIEFLAGTAERRARLAPIGRDDFPPGDRGFARLHIDGDPVALLPGDRFIARGFARTETGGATLGGGMVLDIAPPHRRRSDPVLLRELEVFSRRDRRSELRERVRRAGFTGVDAGELAREMGLEPAELEEQLSPLEGEGSALRAGSQRWLDAQVVGQMRERLLASLDAYHAASPLRPGMPRGTLRGQLPENVRPESAELVLTQLEAAGEIACEGDLVRRPAHQPTLDARSESIAKRMTEEARAAGLEPASPRDWAQRLGVEPEHFRNLAAHLERQGELVRAPGDLWFARTAVDELRARVVSHLEQHGQIDTAAYKELTGTTRRTTVPLMELLDELHVTRRKGDVRILRSG
jgi:selenocysteine-specific elongation factor